MATFKKPTSAQFKKLLLSCIDNNGYNDIELVTDAQKIAFAAETIQTELPHLMRDGYITAEQCQYWLQGLASACTIPFYNNEIAQWWCYQSGMDFSVLSEKHYDMICDQYWTLAARALQVILQSESKGFKAI